MEDAIRPEYLLLATRRGKQRRSWITVTPAGDRAATLQLMRRQQQTGKLGSLDVVELNPALDVRNKTAAVAVDLIESLFGKSTLIRRPTLERTFSPTDHQLLAAGAAFRPVSASGLPKSQ